MFCTDDKHPSDLLEKGHIDYIVKKAIGLGVDPIMAIKAACHNAARYFLLNNRGAIAPGYLGDFVVIDNFEDFNIELVLKKGKLMYDGGLKDFDKAYADGMIKGVLSSNLTYRTRDLLERDWFHEVDCSKYASYLIAAVNHDVSVSNIIDPKDKVEALLEK
jgi:adenine deaminase